MAPADLTSSAVWRRVAPLAVLLVAALLRLVALGHPPTLVFDETYYVKDALTLSRFGYETAWPPDADARFNSGETDISLSSPSFVAHPPVGKWIIAAGLAVFGPADPFGWRVGVALCGILLVAATMLAAHLLWRRTALTVLAGGLLAIDGNGIVMSRVALLDTPLALFALLGMIAVLLDRAWLRRRLEAWAAARAPDAPAARWGPVLAWRPWLLAAGALFGVATGIKWSGAWFLAAAGIAVVVSEVLERRRAGVRLWAASGLLAQGPIAFLSMVPVAAAVHLAGWTGWFATDGGYDRQWLERGGEAWSGGLAWVPDWFQNWWHYQASVYAYHVGLDAPHGYQANPLTWLFMVRPTSMYYETPAPGWSATILDVANPLIWWASTAAAFFLVVRVVLRLRRRERVWREAFVLTGLAAGYLPWLLYLDRTVFQFYGIAYQPYLILALAFALTELAGPPGDVTGRRAIGLRVVAGFVALCVLVSAFFLPVWTGMPVPYWFFAAHIWLPSWM